MKYPLFAVVLLVSPLARAQTDTSNVLKATSRLRDDGTTANMVTDPVNHTAEETILNTKSGKVIRRTVASLNERNLATSVIHYGPNNVIRYKEKYVLDTSDRVIESKLFSATDQPLGRRVFTFDARGNAKVDDYNANGVLLARPQQTSPARPDKRTEKVPVRRATPVR